MDYKSVNKVLLLGNLGKDAEKVTTQNNVTIVSFSMATTERIRNEDNTFTDRTEWHKVVLIGRIAESLHPYLKKGSKIYVEGRLVTRKWTDKEDNERTSIEVRGENILLLSEKPVDKKSSENKVVSNKDDMPF